MTELPPCLSKQVTSARMTGGEPAGGSVAGDGTSRPHTLSATGEDACAGGSGRWNADVPTPVERRKTSGSGINIHSVSAARPARGSLSSATRAGRRVDHAGRHPRRTAAASSGIAKTWPRRGGKRRRRQSFEGVGYMASPPSMNSGARCGPWVLLRSGVGRLLARFSGVSRPTVAGFSSRAAAGRPQGINTPPPRSGGGGAPDGGICLTR